MAKRREVTFTLYGVTGYGKNKTEAKADAERRLEAADLGGDFGPFVFERRGVVMLLYRTPRFGWQYRDITGEGGRIVTGRVFGNDIDARDFREAEARVRRSLWDATWRYEDGPEAPDFITDERERGEWKRRHEWYMWCEEARRRGVENSEARRAYADARQSGHIVGAIQMYRLSPELAAEVMRLWSEDAEQPRLPEERAA